MLDAERTIHNSAAKPGGKHGVAETGRGPSFATPGIDQLKPAQSFQAAVLTRSRFSDTCRAASSDSLTDKSAIRRLLSSMLRIELATRSL